MFPMSRLSFITFATFALAACASNEPAPPPPTDTAATSATTTIVTAENAGATLQPGTDEKANGTLTFTQTTDGVKVVGRFQGLAPKTKHGIHVHETGDCSDPKFASAGGHFNPTNAPHGGPNSPEKHIGDFGNLSADSKGRAKIELFMRGARLDNSATGLLGRAVIVHKKADDLKSQPSGNSGDRIACGTIQAAAL